MSNISRGSILHSILVLLVLYCTAGADNGVGVRGHVGCGENPRQVERLQITKPGVYENFLVDSNWAGGNRVKITADDVTLRNCEIRNATGNGVGVFGRNVTIENCKIHHLLSSTFADQHDAHGITGRWYNVTICNCEIFYVSGDCIQFDPDRKSTGKLLIENCTQADRRRHQRRPRSPGQFRGRRRTGRQRLERSARNVYAYRRGHNRPNQSSARQRP